MSHQLDQPGQAGAVLPRAKLTGKTAELLQPGMSVRQLLQTLQQREMFLDLPPSCGSVAGDEHEVMLMM